MGDIINKILISRGALKKKFKVKQPLIEVTYPEESTPLSPKQMDCISFLKKSMMDLKNYIDFDSDDYKRLWEQHLECISEVVRAGLIWHPLVSDFIYTHKALGSKEILRKIRRGWETGVKRPLTINDLQFRNRLEKIYKYRKEGKTWLQIRQTLMKRKFIKKMSWQALQKKFEKAWVEEWKKVNKKAPPIP